MDKQKLEKVKTEQMTEKKKKKKKGKKLSRAGCGGTMLYLLIIVGISLLLSLFIVFSANDIFAFVKSDKQATLTIDENTNMNSLGGELKDQGIINHSLLFDLFVTLSGKNTTVTVGNYNLTANMDYQKIMRTLRGVTDTGTLRVTIPEGYTVSQIRQLLLDKGVCMQAELDAALSTQSYDYGFLQGMTPGTNWLEGYLFPDTYEFYQKDDATKVVAKMLTNFQTKYDATIQEGAAAQGMTTRQIVTIASIIEREGQVEDEFEVISSVIYNRLRSEQFPYLQSDATVQYAVGEHKKELTAADLEVNSPYNTYKQKGLPPGPIASPGYMALYTASHPKDTKYYYFVSMPDGTHLFASTNEEHNANVAQSKAAQQTAQ